jgi:RNA polymerase-binding transcription factor DksA
MKTIITLRRLILERLCHHLVTHYDTDFSSEHIIADRLSASELRSLLSFKSDSQLDTYVSALDRMEHGTYGICIRCKHRIRFGQLQKDPVTRLCLACEVAMDPSHEHFTDAPANSSRVIFGVL